MAENPVKFSDLFDPLGPGTTDLLEFTAAVQSLGRNYRAFGKNLEGDAARVKGVIDALSTQASQLRGQATDINLLNEKERAGMAALQAEAIKLVQERQRLEAVLAAQAKAQRTVKDATTEATSALRAQQNELREAFKAQDQVRIEKAALALRSARTETLSLSAALRGANSEFSAAKGSYDALDAENKKLVASLKALEGGIGAGSGEALRLQKQITANTETLKAFDENILVFNRNVGNYKGGFSGLIAELAKARAAQAGLTEGTAEAARQQMVVSGFQTAAQKSAAQMGLSYEQAEAKINGATAALQPLATSLLRLEKEQVQVAKTTGEESEQYRKLGFQIQQTKKQLDDVAVATTQAEVKQEGLGQQLGLTKEGLKQYVTQLAVGYVGFQALAGAVQAVFATNVEYSRNLAEVRKTTGLTADEAERLAESLKKLDTPTTLAGLLKIASVGGQLGVAKEGILAFTKSIDIAVQALGNDFSGGAEEIATVLGKISSVFRKELGPDAAQNILAIGSAVNQLGADGAATAPFLTDVALRVGAIAAQAGIGLKDVLAYAAVLQETGFSAETSGTALNRFFSTLSTRTKESYAIAKNANPALTLKEFAHLVNTDFNAAAQLFLKGLNAGGKTTTALNRELATLKLQSGEAKNAIITLAQNTELFAERQQTANDQLRDATSLAAEAAINTDTLAGSYDKLKNNISAFFTTGKVAGFFKGLIDFAKDGIFYQQQLQQTLAQTVGKTTAAALSARGLASGVQDLLATYQQLSGTTGRTAAEQQKLNTVVLSLKDQLGDAAVSIDKQTGAYVLNTAAVQTAIQKQHELSDAQTTTLAKQLKALNDQRDAAKLTEAALSQSTDTRAKQLTEVASPDQLARIQRYLTLLREGSYLAKAGLPVQVTQDQVDMVQALQAETEKLGEAGTKLEKIDRDRATVLVGLKKLGFDEAQALALLTESTKKGTAADDKDIDAKKKKAQAIADLLKAQLELRKFELDQQARDFDRQAANVANSDEVRTRAIEKAADRRREIARLDEQQAEHEAELKNAKLVGGDKTLAVERQLIHAQFLAKIKDIGLDSDKQLLALAQATADQLAQIDKVQLEAEIGDLERVAQDEDKSYTERQLAAVEASQLRIKVIVLESEAKRRAAKGDVEELARIQLEEDKLRADALRPVRANNADVANNDLNKSTTTVQTALEKSLGGQLATRASYTRAMEQLEDQFLAQKLANLQADGTKQKEAAELELQIEERKNAQKVKKEEEYQQVRAQIIQQGFATTQAFADAFFQIGNDQRAAEVADLQASKQEELTAAGDNAALKAKIEEDYAKRELEAKRKQAQYDKAQALFNVAINTAMAVTSVLSTGGGTRYADFGISAGILSALVIASGIAQAVAIAAKPLPSYFVGRDGGPAEFANLGERGPELVGKPGALRLVTQPTVGYLAAGDRVYTAPETRQLLAQNELHEGRLVQRQYANDLDQQTARLRVSAARQEQAQQRAIQQSNAEVIAKLDQVQKAIQQQEYYRLNEQDDLVRRSHRENGWRDTVNRRYKRGRGE